MSSAFKSCLNCSNRTVGCHGTCEKYIQEKAEHKYVTHQKFLRDISMKAGRRESVDRMKKRRASNGITSQHRVRVR